MAKFKYDNTGTPVFVSKVTVDHSEMQINGKKIENSNQFIQLIQDQNKEIADLRSDLRYVLDQVLGAFTNGWCIDWNFTEIREKWGMENEEENNGQ